MNPLLFQALSALLAVSAAYAYSRGESDYTFALGLLAFCSLMFSFRIKARERIRAFESARDDDTNSDA